MKEKLFFREQAKNSKIIFTSGLLLYTSYLFKKTCCCLFQTSRDMSTYVEFEDIWLCNSVFHRAQLYHFGNGAAWHTAVQHRM